MNAIISFFLWAFGVVYFTFSFMVLSLCLVLFSKNRSFSMARRLFSVMIRMMGIRLAVSGQDHIDPDKTYLMMGNHQSLFDLFVIPVAIPTPFVGVEAAYHFSIPLWGNLIRRWGNIPISRNDLNKAIQSLEKAKETIASGTSILVLPEGHRTLNGKIGTFKKGPFHLARKAGADILPFAVNGLFDYNPKKTVVLRPGKVRVTIGKPIAYAAFKDDPVDVLKERIRRTIIDLGQP